MLNCINYLMFVVIYFFFDPIYVKEVFYIIKSKSINENFNNFLEYYEK